MTWLDVHRMETALQVLCRGLQYAPPRGMRAVERIAEPAQNMQRVDVQQKRAEEDWPKLKPLCDGPGPPGVVKRP
jgi:hypothetical protein